MRRRDCRIGMRVRASRRFLRAFRTEYAMGEPVRAERPLWVDDGELTIALTVHAHKFSKAAQEKITKAGGKFEVL